MATPSDENAQVPIDVYPVGVLSDIQRITRALFLRDDRLNGKRIGIVRSVLRSERRYLVSKVRERDWRNLRNSFNGYLAEHQGCAHNCGKGWTKRAARRRAERLCQRHITAALTSLDHPTSPGAS